MISHRRPNGKSYPAKPQHVCLWFFQTSDKEDERIPSNMKIERFPNGLCLVTFKEHNYGSGWLNYYCSLKRVHLSGENGGSSLYDNRQGDILNLPIPLNEMKEMLDDFGITHP